MTYTTAQAERYNSMPTEILNMEANLAADKANMLFIGLVSIVFALGTLPLSVLDYMSLTETAGGVLI